MMIQNHPTEASQDYSLPGLSLLECRILQAIAQKEPYSQICEELNLSNEEMQEKRRVPIRQ